MRSQLFRLSSMIDDTAHAHEGWPDVLNSLMQAMRIPSAAYIIRSKTTESVDWVCVAGLSADCKSDYVNQYAALDPYLPVLGETWTKLSECLPEAVLRKSEWYNDFVLQCGVRDILGTRLIDTPSHCVIMGLHQRIGRTFADDAATILSLLSTPLKRAARCHLERLRPATDATREQPVGRADKSTYYFHIRNGSQYPDETGAVFASPGEAIAHAAVLAGEFVNEGDWRGFSIHVVNQHGKEIARVPIE